MKIELRTKQPEPQSLCFDELEVNQMIADKDGWIRIKISNVQYLLMQDNNDITVHTKNTWPLLSGSAQDIKLIVEEI